MKLVRAIREGRILPYKPPEEREREADEQEEIHFDLWQNEEPQAPNPLHIPAPKLPPPGYDLSYNPPEEYLPYVRLGIVCATLLLTSIPDRRRSGRSGKMRTQKTERNRTSHKSTMLCARCPLGVPWSTRGLSDAWYVNSGRGCGFSMLIFAEKDLYLAPRIRKNRLNIDPNSLLPKLPSPSELKPFPTVVQTVFRGHEGRVRSLVIDPVSADTCAPTLPVR